MTTNSNFLRAPVDNTGLDPLQGFDIDLWVTDVYTGLVSEVGKFQSITLSLRDATETYLELGQRVPIYLNGEIQVAWVLERGMVDAEWLYRWFGTTELSRAMYLTRGPRFQISVDFDAVGLSYNSLSTTINSANNQSQPSLWGPQVYGTSVPSSGYALISGDNPSGSSPLQDRSTQGRYELIRCKVDSISLGGMPGRRVIAQRWEGVAEGIRYVNSSAQTTWRNQNNATNQSLTGVNSFTPISTTAGFTSGVTS